MLILTIESTSLKREASLLTYTLETYPKDLFTYREIHSKLELFQTLQNFGKLPEGVQIYLTSKKGTRSLSYITERLPQTSSVVRITKDPTLKTCLCFGAVLSTPIEKEESKDFQEIFLRYGEPLWTVCDFFDDDITYAIKPLLEDSRVKVFSVYDDYIVDELCPSFYYKTLSAIEPERTCLGFINNPIPEEQNLFLNTWKLFLTKTTDTVSGESREDWAFGIYNNVSGELEFLSPYYFASRVCYVPYKPLDSKTVEIQESCTLRDVIVDLFSGDSWNEYYTYAINSNSFLLTFSTAFPSWCSLVNLEEGKPLFSYLFYRFAKQYTKEYRKAFKSERFRVYKAFAITEKVPEDFSVLAHVLKNTSFTTLVFHLKLVLLERKMFSF